MNKIFPLLLFLLTAQSVQAANDGSELLEPDQAFALAVQARDADTLEVRWKIAPGYYMYRDKFKFESLDPAITLKPAMFPKGHVKSDPSFGSVETYHDSVIIALPIGQRAAGAASAKLRVTGQGCNEPVGVCYPPVVKEVSVKLAALNTTGASATKSGGKSLKDLFGSGTSGGNEQDFLPADRAFVLTTEAADANTVVADIRIAPGYYLYRDRTSVKLTRGDGIKLGTPDISRGKVKTDPYIGKTEVLHDQLTIRIPLERATRTATDIELEIGYQGCAEKGICYPPEKKNVALKLAALDGTDNAKQSILTAKTKPPVVEGESYLKLIFAAFGAGLLLTFTPCVLPMVPILSGVIIRSGDQTLSKVEAGLVSYSYVLGTAVTYTIAGVLAGATGEQLQAYFQNPWAISVFAAILAFLALSMFGLYELQMPSFVQSKLHYHSHKIKGGSFMGAFGLGLVSALIVGACVSPVLIGILGVAITKGDPVLGGLIMFAMAHGQGIALVGAGIGAGFLLPKAGTWMDKIKYVFGVMLLGVSVYLLGYLPQVPVLLLWAALFIVTGVYMGATQTLPHDSAGWRFLWKGIGTFLLIWGALALLGGLMGERDILKPVPLAGMARLAGGNTATASTAPVEMFRRFTRMDELDALLARARQQGKPVVIDYFATWCTDCARMEKAVFTDPRFVDASKRFELLQADVTENSADSSALKKRYGVYGPPAVVFIDKNGESRTDLNFHGYRNVDVFLAILGRL